ncbi:MAG TPA: YaiI/YqxD family protein [Candidatus Obscuribacterales bacterium]
MRIWIDADACPGAVRDIVVAAANRRAVQTIFVANKSLRLPESPYLSLVQVEPAPDAADLYIREHAERFDVVVTPDIPLAHILIPGGIVVIDPRGDTYTQDNIGDRLAARNLMQELRDSGQIMAGPKQFGDREKRAFAAAFDREVTRLLKLQSSG